MIGWTLILAWGCGLLQGLIIAFYYILDGEEDHKNGKK